jgi:hypothetical protein
MAHYVQLGQVRTWYDEHGDGDPLVLMHGGLVEHAGSHRISRLWPSGSTSTHRKDAATGTAPTSTGRSPTS